MLHDHLQAPACSQSLAGCAEVIRRRLARTAIGHDFVADLLAFAQRAEASAFDGADVHEYVVAAFVRLNEAITLGGVKPLHGSHAHEVVPSQYSSRNPRLRRRPVGIEFLEGSSV